MALCDDFTQSYCARRRGSRASSLAHDRAEKQAAVWLHRDQGECGERTRSLIAEPKGGYTAGVESTVCRGVLSELYEVIRKVKKA